MLFLPARVQLSNSRTHKHYFLPYPSISLHTVTCATVCRRKQCPATSPRYVLRGGCLCPSSRTLDMAMICVYVCVCSTVVSRI